MREAGLLSLFRYAQHQRIKAATTGPALRAVLLESRYGRWRHSWREGYEPDLRPLFESPLFVRLAGRLGFSVATPEPPAPLPSDPLALDAPSDDDLEAAFRDLARQVREHEQAMRASQGTGD